MKYKEKIENNIFAVIAVCCVCTSGAVFTFVDYHTKQKVEALEAEFELEKAVVQGTLDKAHEEMQEIRDEFARKLFSIERNIDGDISSIDISQFQIGLQNQYKIRGTHREYLEGKFFLEKNFDFSDWQQGPASNSTALEFTFPKEHMEKVAETLRFSPALTEKRGWAFSSPDVVEIPHLYRHAGYVRQRLEVRSSVILLPLDNQFRERLLLEYPSVMASHMSIGEDNVGMLDMNLSEVVDELERMERSELIDDVSLELVNSPFRHCQSINAIPRIVSFQRKGNIAYARVNCLISSSLAQSTFMIDTESIFIGSPSGGLLIRMTVPSADFNADAYNWVQNWLLSVKVPL